MAHKFSGELSRRYGTALFDVLKSSSKNKNDFEKSMEQIRIISSCCSKKIIHFFQLASLTSVEKTQTFEVFLKYLFPKEEVSKDIFSFFETVILNKRFSHIGPILIFFLKKADEYLGIARATIISARTIQENEMKEFESSLAQTLNKKVIFTTQLDESLKSGYVVRLGHTSIDASFKARLNGLKELFN